MFIGNTYSQETKEIYCKVSTIVSLNGKAKLIVDYGNGFETISDKLTGKAIIFKSVVDGLNHLGQEGWIVVNFTTIKDENNTNEDSYLMKKVVTK